MKLNEKTIDSQLFANLSYRYLKIWSDSKLPFVLSTLDEPHQRLFKLDSDFIYVYAYEKVWALSAYGVAEISDFMGHDYINQYSLDIFVLHSDFNFAYPILTFDNEKEFIYSYVMDSPDSYQVITFNKPVEEPSKPRLAVDNSPPVCQEVSKISNYGLKR